MLESRLQVTAAVIIVAIAGAVVVSDVELPDAQSAFGATDVQTFDSEQEFYAYIQQGAQRSYSSGASGELQSGDMARDELDATPETESGGGSETTVERYSETNVQEEGVQEPDILKTNGESFFYAPQSRIYQTIRTEDIYYPGSTQANISTFDATPPGNISELGEVPENGEMFLHEDRLVVLADSGIYGFDVSDPAAPEQVYHRALNGSIVDARRINNKMVLVQRQSVSQDGPCPLRPASGLTVSCTSIYHPSEPVQVDATYTAMRIDVTSGEIGSSTSMVGSEQNTELYMSQDNLYLTYLDQMSEAELIIGYFTSDDQDVVPDSFVEGLEELESYELSQQATYQELQYRLQQYMESLSDKERQEFQTQVRHGIGNYTADRKRQLSTTGIVKIGLGDDLSVRATGEVPGQTLNQFSMDEHDGNLRIVTTVGEQNRFGATAVETENDLYILDEGLDQRGSITGMGLTQRVYSARFLDDTGYVVTFRQIDPFYVLDLSDPDNPTLEGELKLPGYSSYLHPLSEDRVLGLGEEERQPKAAIFDVSDPSDPTVEDDHILNDYSSAVTQNHHAFLIDRRHEIFFWPSNSGGNIFNYTDGLEKIMTVDISDPQRARYVNDYLYIFSDHEVAVVDETDWSVENTLVYQNQTGISDPYPMPGPEPIR